MHEHIVRALYYFEVHLLYASLVGLAAWLLTSNRRGSATTKYWIWVAATLNFILPVGALLDRIGSSHLAWATPLGVIGDAANRVSRGPVATLLGAAWLLGAGAMLARLGWRLRAERGAARTAPGHEAADAGPSFFAGVPVRFVSCRQVPAVDGLLRPRISLPHGIDRLLSAHELDAVLIHELTHARRRDNLIRLLYEVGLCALWFHPLVWIAGARLACYRELSCDESVIASARAVDLVSALAKLLNPERAFLLRASASSFLGQRLARLAAQPRPAGRAASALQAAAFGAALLAGIFFTVAHTACCFVVRT